MKTRAVLAWAGAAGLGVLAVVALVALVGGILLKLGYVVTLWNSQSIVWLRQRVFAPEAQGHGDQR